MFSSKAFKSAVNRVFAKPEKITSTYMTAGVKHWIGIDILRDPTTKQIFAQLLIRSPGMSENEPAHGKLDLTPTDLRNLANMLAEMSERMDAEVALPPHREGKP